MISNHDLNLKEEILRMDASNYYKMNVIDYVIGNNDRHSSNWGVQYQVEGRKRKILGLHPLYDFNQAFCNYELAEGSLCLPAYLLGEKLSQREAARQALSELTFQLEEIPKREWFGVHEEWYDGCMQRIKELRIDG